MEHHKVASHPADRNNSSKTVSAVDSIKTMATQVAVSQANQVNQVNQVGSYKRNNRKTTVLLGVCIVDKSQHSHNIG